MIEDGQFADRGGSERVKNSPIDTPRYSPPSQVKGSGENERARIDNAEGVGHTVGIGGDGLEPGM